MGPQPKDWCPKKKRDTEAHREDLCVTREAQMGGRQQQTRTPRTNSGHPLPGRPGELTSRTVRELDGLCCWKPQSMVIGYRATGSESEGVRIPLHLKISQKGGPASPEGQARAEHPGCRHPEASVSRRCHSKQPGLSFLD